MTSSALPSSTPAEMGSEKHQPIFLWATPRSVSTAFERVMKNSGHLTICHEPFTETYYFGSDRISRRYGDLPDDTYSENFSRCSTNYRLYQRSLNSRIFVKDLAFQAEPFIDNLLLAKSINIFITSRPISVYSSLIKLKPDMTEDEFGFVALERMFNRAMAFQEKTIVIDGTKFRNEPQLVLRKVCDFIKIPFREGLLHWEDGRIRNWKNCEEKSQAMYHVTLENSTTIMPVSKHESVSVRAEHKRILRTANRIYKAFETHML